MASGPTEEIEINSPDGNETVQFITVEDPLDLPAAILYIVFNAAEAIVPVTVFYTLI